MSSYRLDELKFNIVINDNELEVSMRGKMMMIGIWCIVSRSVTTY
jgi:hypothetical protein